MADESDVDANGGLRQDVQGRRAENCRMISRTVVYVLKLTHRLRELVLKEQVAVDGGKKIVTGRILQELDRLQKRLAHLLMQTMDVPRPAVDTKPARVCDRTERRRISAWKG